MALIAAQSGESWSSPGHFLLAATGVLLGLGSLWRFPYLATDYGGGAFVVVYLVALVALGLPLLIAIWLPGRRTQFGPVTAYRLLIREAQAHRGWLLVPWLMLAACLLVLSYLGVFGGLTLAYLAHLSVAGLPSDPERLYGLLAGDAWQLVAWQGLFLLLVTAVSAAGLRRGVERASAVAMPSLLLALLALLLLADGHLGVAIGQLFAFDGGALGWRGVLAALTEVVFTLTLGVGVLHLYAARLGPGAPLPRMALQLLLIDTVLALMIALVVLAVLAAAEVTPTGGAALLYIALPRALAVLDGGRWGGIVLYVAAALLVWLTALALLEPLLARLMAARGMTRRRAALTTALAVFACGQLTVFALAEPATWHGLGRGFFEWKEFVAARVLIPVSLLLGVLFVGWVLPEQARRAELPLLSRPLYSVWRIWLRWGVPALLVVVFLTTTGILGGPL